MDMFNSSLEFIIFILFAFLCILCIIFSMFQCIWNALKIFRTLGYGQNAWQSQYEEEVEMDNIVRVHNVENALPENESADAPEI